MNECDSVSSVTAPVPSLWSQVVSAGRYYWPRLKWQVICYAIASLVISVLIAVVSHYNLKFLYFMLMSLVSLMMIFAPLAFARYNSREADITYPVSWQAKSIFMIGYTVIIVPLLTMLLPVLSMEIFPGEVNMKMMRLSMKAFGELDLPPMLEMMMSAKLNIYINGVVPAMLTLFFVVLFKHNVVFKTVLWDVVIGIGLYIALMLYTVYTVFYRIVELSADGEPDPAEVEAVADTTVHGIMIPLIVGSTIFYIVAWIGLMILTAWKIKKRQI